MVQNTESNASQTFAPMKERSENSTSIKKITTEVETDSPFRILTVELDNEEKTFIALGNERVSDFTTEEKCWDMINEKHWFLIVSLITKSILKQEDILKLYKK